MKAVTKVLLLLTLIACAVAPEALQDRRPTSAAKTWRISTPTGSLGSSFPVQCIEIQGGLWQTLFLTAAHMGDEKIGWKVQLNQDTTTRLEGGVILDRHPIQDVMLVRFVSEEPIPVVPLNAQLPRLGEEVWTAGYPKGGPFLISSGNYSGPFREYFTSSAPLCVGNSGGPVLDSKGLAVGIAFAFEQERVPTELGDAVLMPIYHLSYFTPIFSIAEWLEGFGIL